jgi:hypothetical protein
MFNSTGRYGIAINTWGTQTVCKHGCFICVCLWAIHLAILFSISYSYLFIHLLLTSMCWAWVSYRGYRDGRHGSFPTRNSHPSEGNIQVNKRSLLYLCYKIGNGKCSNEDHPNQTGVREGIGRWKGLESGTVPEKSTNSTLVILQHLRACF